MQLDPWAQIIDFTPLPDKHWHIRLVSFFDFDLVLLYRLPLCLAHIYILDWHIFQVLIQVRAGQRVISNGSKKVISNGSSVDIPPCGCLDG